MNKTDKRARGRPRTLDRDHVMKVAMMSYWADGSTAVSINEICKRAEISKPGLYREFGSEDGLKKAVIIAYYEMMYAPFFEALQNDSSFERDFEAVIAFILEGETNPELPSGCLFVEMCQSRKQLGTMTAQKIDGLRKNTLECYADWIDRAKARGDLPENISTPMAALYVNTQLASAASLLRQPVELSDVETFLRMAFSIFVRTPASDLVIPIPK